MLKEEKLPEKPQEKRALPQLALVFNSTRRVLKCDGFPSYLKQIAEIVECGELSKFRKVEFVQTISRFGNTQQRWGV